MERLVAAIGWWYPVALVASFHVTWFVAWAVLGHRPKANWDDPIGMSPWVTVGYALTAALMIGIPFAMALGIGSMIWSARQRRWSSNALAAAAVMFLASWIAAFVILFSDPLGVVVWFID